MRAIRTGLVFHCPGLELETYGATAEDYRRFKRVIRVVLRHQSDLDILLEHQGEKNYPKRLYAEVRDIRIQKLLPLSIKELDLQDLMYGDDVKMLPRQLERLRVDSASSYDPATFPPCWTIEQVEELPKSLHTLHLPFYLIGEGNKLASISGLFLEHLRLSAVSSKQLKCAQEWLPTCLPPYLLHLTLAADPCETKSEETKISADCIRLCRLREVVPRLASCVIEMRFNNDAPMGPLFASLPANMTFLYIEFMAAVFQPGELSLLPRSLKYLTLNIQDADGDESTGCMTNEHFQGLPERLENLTMTPPANLKVDASVMKYLPNSLAEFLLQSREASQISSEIGEQIKKNSCPRYDDL